MSIIALKVGLMAKSRVASNRGACGLVKLLPHFRLAKQFKRHLDSDLLEIAQVILEGRLWWLVGRRQGSPRRRIQ